MVSCERNTVQMDGVLRLIEAVWLPKLQFASLHAGGAARIARLQADLKNCSSASARLFPTARSESKGTDSLMV